MFFKANEAPVIIDEGFLSPSAVARLALFIFAAAALLNVLERIIVAITVPNTLSFQADIQFEVANLKRQAKLLNNPDTFAQCAKLERKALALEKQLSRLQAQESTAKSNYLLRVPGVMRTGGLLCVFVLSYRVPVAVALRSEWVWPFGRSLAMGTGKSAITGLIGLLPWAVLSHRSSKALFGLRRRASS